MVKSESYNQFKLLKWFGSLSFFVITGIALAQALLISKFLTYQIFIREGELSQEFVQNILIADGTLDYLIHPEDQALAEKFTKTIKHFNNMHDLLRANIYSTNGTIIWSTENKLRGVNFQEENDELEGALKGKLVVNPAHISEWFKEKNEHVGINPAIEYFIECYIPVVEPSTGKVIGVIEFYKAPVSLTNAIKEGQVQVWLAAIVSAIALFLSLFWVVRRADNLIKNQHKRIVENETMVLLGELASSVAHNIRNPLSSIRSAAELALESPKDDCTEQAQDIIYGVDRISRQINELLKFSIEDSKQNVAINLKTVLENCVSQHLKAFERKNISIEFFSTANISTVIADETLLQQVFHSILSNASESMEDGGVCQIKLMDDGYNSICVEISDTGTGIPQEIKEKVFRPFFSTKPKGLGLGLSLVVKIIERFNGTISIRDNVEKGTIVKILLPRE